MSFSNKAYSTEILVDDGAQLIQLSGIHVRFSGLQPYANNAAAISGGLSPGDDYLVLDVTTGSYQIQVVA